MHEHLAFAGLSQNESVLYLAGLKHGSLPASRLAELSAIKRVSVYGFLESLIRQGLAERSMASGRMIFAMKKPEIIRSLILDKQKLAQTLLSDFPLELKNLSVNSSPEKQSRIQVFKGLREVTGEIRKLAKHKAAIFWMGNLHALVGLIPEKELFQLFSAKRMKHPTTTKAITDPSINTLPRFRETVGSYRQLRFLPIQNDSIIALWEDTIGIFSAAQTPTLILIRDFQTSSLLKIVFNALWETLPKP